MSSEPVNSDAIYLQSKCSVETAGSPISSPLSSPPTTPTPPAANQEMAASKGEVTSADEMPPPPHPAKRDASGKPSTVSRKRSREVVDDDAYLADGSQTAAGPESTSRAKTREHSTDSAATVVKISQSQQDAETSSQKVPPSGQGHAPAAVPAAKPKTKSKAKTVKASQKLKQVPQEQPTNQEGEASEYETDTDATVSTVENLPEEQLETFEWHELEARYHAKVHESALHERRLLDEFSELMSYFYVWAEAGQGKEVDRSFKRLKTQVAYVQHEEQELEKKRQHYIKVVNAFKTVGVLLDKPNWHQHVVPGRRRISGLRTSIENDQLDVARRIEGQKEIVQMKGWPPHVVDDIDMMRYHYPDHHAARCVVL